MVATTLDNALHDATIKFLAAEERGRIEALMRSANERCEFDADVDGPLYADADEIGDEDS